MSHSEGEKKKKKINELNIEAHEPHFWLPAANQLIGQCSRQVRGK